jgi:hypothetical protein
MRSTVARILPLKTAKSGFGLFLLEAFVKACRKPIHISLLVAQKSPNCDKFRFAG